jgi:hypothetical protein
MNSHVKAGNGRFYLDEEYLDIAYSIRVSYFILEAFPIESIQNSIFAALDFYVDAASPLYSVSKGNISTEEACNYMDKLWGN